MSAFDTESTEFPAPVSQTAKSATESSVRWDNLQKLSGELIGAVERAVKGCGGDFDAILKATRLELADDYSFLDPFAARFNYTDSTITSLETSAPDGYVSGVTELLRRIVNKIAGDDQFPRARERVAVELAMVARSNRELLRDSEFSGELDPIAGTKVI